MLVLIYEGEIAPYNSIILAFLTSLQENPL